MRATLHLEGLITVGGREIALGKTHALLDGIARERSLRGAAERLNLSYRSAWGQVLSLEEALGRPVAVKTKGHGSVLTEFGAALRDTLAATLASFDALLGQETRSLENRLATLLGEAVRTVRLALSHDPLLLQILADAPTIVPSIVGSEEAAALLLSGKANAAGFHAGETGPVPPAPFDVLFRNPAWSARPLFVREQGLLVGSGNPLSIHSVADIARLRARLVNRQRGSGTRAWFDRLLRDAEIQPAAIVGYEVEEFTHHAVAALIAAGAADVGMGARSVAERFGLGFVPVGEEAYYLAGPPEIVAELSARTTAALDGVVPGMAGYQLPPASPGHLDTRA
jgi:putative molybdopterin biosynthesis protein